MAEKEYNEREAVKEKLSPMLNDPEAIDFWEWQCSEIDDIPAADVRPVVRGTWITRPYMIGNTQYCSLCGENYGMKYNFCPNCGAMMEES